MKLKFVHVSARLSVKDRSAPTGNKIPKSQTAQHGKGASKTEVAKSEER